MKADPTFNFESRIELVKTTVWSSHFAVPAEIAEQLVEGKDRRVICRVNGADEYQCAIAALKSGRFLIYVNKKLRDSLGLADGTQVQVQLRKDRSEYGLPMPEEFREVLNQDPEGDRFFHALTAGKQRSLLYYIGAVKDPDKRIHRGIVILEHLKTRAGKLDNQMLAEELKRPIF